jgi:adenosine/AMP kinase
LESPAADCGVKIEEVLLEVPEGSQLILGQSHFIKTVEDLYEVMASSMPGIKFGVAFCEASGKAHIRNDGTDDEALSTARNFAGRLKVGHCFVVLMKGAFPINVLNRIKGVEEVVGIYCATSNNVTAFVGESGEGRGILGVADGVSPKGEESQADKAERHEFLRKIGYKR